MEFVKLQAKYEVCLIHCMVGGGCLSLEAVKKCYLELVSGVSSRAGSWGGECMIIMSA